MPMRTESSVTASFVLALCSACTVAPANPRASASPQPPASAPAANAAPLPAPRGYYRQPTIHGDTIVFCAEGDLWRANASGGIASRLTTHTGKESSPAISPDGQWVAFLAEYEGPTEAYVMPAAGGLPKRLTWDGRALGIAGWRGGRVIVATDRFSTLPSWQLMLIDPNSGANELVPLAQASDGCYGEDAATGRSVLFFTRLHFQGSHTKRYKGGTAQNLWRFADGDAEAAPLTADYTGASSEPMWWSGANGAPGRLFFASDRDGTMELWSMTADGRDLRQHTHHDDFDVRSPSIGEGRIVFQLGADLWRFDIATDREQRIDVTLNTDFDQTREKWIANPFTWISAAHIAPEGKHVAMTARGRVFVAPRSQGRLVDATPLTPKASVRHRDARFMPDGKTVLSLSDQSGEVELWTFPANGVGDAKQLTSDGNVLRWQAAPSPDGKRIAHHDKNLRLWLYNTETGGDKQIDETNVEEGFADVVWSPDSRWLAYVITAVNHNRQIKLQNVETGQIAFATTDRYDSSSPAWSPDGKWLYLLSERNLQSLVGSPWGRMQPEPMFDRKTKIYRIALQAGERSPFAPEDELHEDPREDDKRDDKEQTKPAESQPQTQPSTQPESRVESREREKASPVATQAAIQAASQAESQPASQPTTSPATAPTTSPATTVSIDLDSLEARLIELPIGPGNYSDLAVTDKRLLWTQRGIEPDAKTAMMFADIARKDVTPKELTRDLTGYELSLDRKTILIRRSDSLHIIDATASAGVALNNENRVDLSGWTFALTPREEWRQMFIEAWRLERDYFYDPNMVNVDWKAALERYLPLVDRVASRDDLGDLISQMVGELSTLHTFVRGGDMRGGSDNVQPASLGAVLQRDELVAGDGGFVVQHIYRHDPDRPELCAPIARPGVDVKEGEIITAINGRSTLSVPDASILLRNLEGKQVLLTVSSADGTTSRQVIVVPFSPAAEQNLRYHEWEVTRRGIVEKESNNDLGYVHIRAMGGGDFADFAREFYPVFTRKGLIIDVRHNRGGNIDSWIIGRLLRKAWFYWQPRIGVPDWNMQFAFRGHVVVLCNERTASDGEAFTEGVKRLKIGHVIGTRTWGGEVWLSASNFLVDRGIATAAETGVYGPEGAWLIEGHGVEPDQVVDNLPHATFLGEDAQLKAAIEYLKRKIEEEPAEVPPAPQHPNLRWPR